MGVEEVGDRPTVLVVDDDRQVADLFAEWLSSDYRVRTAYGGREALETLREERETIDVVLLDRRMPDVSGDMVLVSLRDAGFDCPVALVTGVRPDFDIVGRGFDDYLVKPVDERTLLGAVEALLEVDSYDALLRELSGKRVRRNVLRVEKSPAELDASEAYARLERDIEVLERRLALHRARVETTASGTSAGT